MSVVAAKVYKDKIVIAADSIIIRGYSKILTKTNFSKLEEVNNIIIGSVGLAEERSLMIRFLQTHKPESPTEKDVLEFISEFAQWKQKYSNANIENEYLLAIDGHLFNIEGLYVYEVLDFSAIGAGMDYANTALYLGHSPEEAVIVACEMCCYIAKPITTKTMLRTEV